MPKFLSIILIGGLCALPWSAVADVTMPGIFGDHMVLQQGAQLPVWGWAAPGEAVKVTLAEETVSTTAAADGSWKVAFSPRPRVASDAPQTLTIAGANTLVFKDVLIGDVWVASGQSNMAFGILNDSRAAEAVAGADHPRIRLFQVKAATALAPRRGDELQGEWVVCTPESLKAAGPRGFSAAGYYFARDIQAATGHPIGMIGTYWGGTPAQAWTSLEGLRKEPSLSYYAEEQEKLAAGFQDGAGDYARKKAEFDAANRDWYRTVGKEYEVATKAWQKASAEAVAAGQPAPAKPRATAPKPVPPVAPDGGQTAPGNLFNAMVAPLIPYGIKGVIWYQGEANGGVRKGPEYATLFPRLITDWREHWGQGDFPFIFVQLANFQAPAKAPVEAGGYTYVREAQLQTLRLPATAMAVTIDIGDSWDIHPKNKLDVGKRLALAARRLAYGENIVSSGPIYASLEIQGATARVTFSEIGGGLVAGRDGTEPELKGFAIAGADQKWYFAKATIAGPGVLHLSAPEVPSPVAVRYGWANCPPCNLYNREALPASPFRTDTWPPAQ
jgi:sialate O-acetylesterase